MVVTAAMRDASWFRKPGKARRYHVIKQGRAACGLIALFVKESAQPVHAVPEALRCKRNGCREAFREEGQQ
jgi:hypothetical protein